MKKFINSCLMAVVALTACAMLAACGSDSESDKIENIEIGQSGSLTYTFFGKKYHLVNYLQSSIGVAPIELYHKDREVKWEMELSGVDENESIDGQSLNFLIYTDDVKSGFEFTEDNFSIYMKSPYVNVFEFYEYTKKSGTGKITKMSTKSAEIEFNHFVLEGDKSKAEDIVINGKAVIVVD